MTIPAVSVPDTEALRAHLPAVVAARKVAANAKARIDNARTNWEHMYAGELQQLKDAQASLAAAESAAKILMLAAYKATKDKNPAPGCKVKVGEGSKLVYDAGLALAAAQEIGIALIPVSLNVAAFEAIATAEPAKFPFVTFEDSVTPTLAAKLEEELILAGLMQAEPAPAAVSA